MNNSRAFPSADIGFDRQLLTVADPELYNGGGGADCRAPKFEFLLEKGFFGAFWDDFLRSERHEKAYKTVDQYLRLHAKIDMVNRGLPLPPP